MTFETLDVAYSVIKNMCLDIVAKNNMPYCAMDYVLSKVMCDFQAMHISELTELHHNKIELDADDLINGLQNEGE